MIANQKTLMDIVTLSEKRIDVDLSSFYKDLMDMLGRDRVFISDMNELREIILNSKIFLIF